MPALLPILLPAAVMAVPLLDMLLAVVRRTRAGRSPFSPDKQHLHHRLLELGHSQRRAVLLMYAWTGLLAFTAVGLAFVPPGVAAIWFVARACSPSSLAVRVAAAARPARAHLIRSPDAETHLAPAVVWAWK